MSSYLHIPLASLLLLCLGAAAAAAEVASTGTGARRLLEANKLPEGSSQSNPKRYILDVTVGTRAPDCVARKVILINNNFQPRLTFTQGDWVEVAVVNKLPADWPSVAKGITVHWHGFSLRGSPWMDGTKFVSQCPIPAGTSFTYKFQVNEMPGSYFYHDHSSLNRADGLQGPLVVLPRKDVPPLVSPAPDASDVLFLTDFWHFTGNALAMRLNRPFDPNQATSASGGWCWVGLPRSLLINGLGNYGECEDVYTRKVNQTLPFRSDGHKANSTDLMSPNACVAGQLGATAEPSSCKVELKATGKTTCGQRYSVTAKAGKTQRLRLINAGTLVYMTVCIQSHTLTVVALDAAPVEPRDFFECVDINTGQRVDVLIKPNQAGVDTSKSYWINVGSQYRKGAPSAYGIYRYESSKATPDPSQIIQPGPMADRKWNTSVTMSFRPNRALLDSKADKKKSTAPYLYPNAAPKSFKLPSTSISRRFVLQSTQPLIESNGMLKWALDSIAYPVAPPCKPVLDSVYDNPNWVSSVPPVPSNGPNQALYFTPKGGNASTWEGNGKDLQLVDAAGSSSNVVIKLGKPGAASHVLSLRPGEMVEIVIQNNRAGFNGGQYASANESLTNNRNGREQHSFHLHGHHFWQVGMGMGEWSEDKVKTDYNLVNPPLRDTTTVLFNGTTEDKAAWVALRFVADNPGTWPLHCHIAWHEFMGQGITIIEDAPAIAKAKVPPGMPSCPAKCTYTFANFNPNAAKAVYGSSGLLAPDNSQLP